MRETTDGFEKYRKLAIELLQHDLPTVAAHLQRWLGQKEEFLRV